MASSLSPRSFLYYWLPPLLLVGGVLALSGNLGSGLVTYWPLKWLLDRLPFAVPVDINVIHYYLRKGFHVLGSTVLYLLLFRAFRGHPVYSRIKSCLWSLGLILLLALVTEAYQTRIPLRGGALRDVAVDMAGASLGALIAFLWGRPGPNAHTTRHH